MEAESYTFNRTMTMFKTGDKDVNVLVSNACIACTVCEGITPDAFQMDGYGSTPNPDISEITENMCDAKTACPAQAIHFRRMEFLKRGLSRERVEKSVSEAKSRLALVEDGTTTFSSDETKAVAVQTMEGVVKEGEELLAGYRLR